MVVLIFIFRTAVILGFVARIMRGSWRVNLVGMVIGVGGGGGGECWSGLEMGFCWWSRCLIDVCFIHFNDLFVHYFVQDCSLPIMAIIAFEFAPNNHCFLPAKHNY